MTITSDFSPILVTEQNPVQGSNCCDLTKRVGRAVAAFFTTIILAIYELLNWSCQITATLIQFACRGPNWQTEGNLVESLEFTTAILPDPLTLEPKATPKILAQRKGEAITRLKQIKEDHLQFELNPTVLQFDLDVILDTYNTNHSPLKFLELFDYADPGKNYSFRDKRNQFQEILQEYEPIVEQSKIIRESLSRFYQILNEKIERIGKNIEQIKAIKQQIRSTIVQIMDAHNDCHDQVLSQFETITLDLIASELKPGSATPQEKMQFQAAFVLFKYKSNLIKATCQKQNPNEPHMADLERAIKQQIAPFLDIDLNINKVGALFARIIENREQKITQTGNAVLRRYFNDPTYVEGQRDLWNDLDERPLSYLQRELKAAELYNPSNTLRNNLIAWSSSYFDLDNAPEIVIAASIDPEFDFTMGGDLNPAGVQWLLESSGIIF